MSSASLTFLIVGGCGLLGRNIVTDIRRYAQNARVVVLDSKEPTGDARLPNTRYLKGDITNTKAMDSILQDIKPHAIINVVSPRPFAHGLDFCMKVNCGGSQNLLEAARRVGTVRAFVYTSSSSVVHDSLSDMNNLDESAPVLFMPEQREPYHHSKAMTEKLVLQSNRKDGSRLLTAVLRPSGIFGPGDEQGVASFVASARDGKFKWQIGDGKNLFDWTFVENVARAHVLTAQCLLRESEAEAPRPIEERVEGEAFFITNDEPWPFWDFARAIGAAAGYPTDKSKVRVMPKTLATAIGLMAEWAVWSFSLGKRQATFNRRSLRYSTQTRVFNISKAKTRLGYTPVVSVEEGIRRSGAPYLEAQQREKHAKE